MRNLKKFLALVLATLMVVSAAATVSAYAVFDDVEDDNQYAEAIGKLVEYNITNGIGDGLFGVDNDVERYQMALFMARALRPNETDWANGMKIFDDVEEYLGAIAFAYSEGIVTGIGNNQFDPHAGIRYQDALIMALRALGYTVDVSGDPYWLAAYQQAAKIGLTENVAVNDGSKTLTRAETAQLICNMLKTVPADGGATIEEKNFGVAGVNNTTTVIVTATEKQQYDSATKPADNKYVGIQLIENGIPTGEVKYIKAEDLKIDADKIEDSFAHTYDLVNYNAETESFEDVVAGLDPVAVAGKDVKISGDKFTVNGVAYYPVSEMTGAALKNEIVVYTGGATAGVNKTLVVDKNGSVLDANGVATGATAVTVNGSVLYLYDGAFHTEAEATNKYGITLPGGVITYATYTAAQLAGLKNNYQILLYDDNRDGQYDRATVANVYMDVYNTADGNGNATFGEMKGNKVTYTATLAKGDVFTYTYNAQTKVVNVIEVLAPQSGVLTKINTTNINAGDASKNTYKSVVVTVGGKDYVLANADRVAAGYVGAIVKVTAGAKFNEIKDKAVMNYVNWADLVIGSTLNFVAYGDTIIAAQSKAAGDPYDKAIIKSANGFDTTCIYVDAYVNGVVKKDLAVSSVKIGSTTTEFAKLNTFEFSTKVSNLVNNSIKLGTIFQVREKADGTVSLTSTSYGAEFTQTVAPTSGKITFKGGIADKIAGVLDNVNAIRTDSKTVFYFIGADGVKTLIGSPADDKWIDLSKATVYSNKLGYGTASTNGISGTVIVDCGSNNITAATNIFTTVSPRSTVMILNDSALTFVKATASTLGLSGSDIYRAYSVDAINLNNGEKIDTIYVKESNGNPVVDLTKGGAYSILSSSKSIESAENAAVTVKVLNNVVLGSFIEARNWTITGLTVADTQYHKLNKIVLTDVAKFDTSKALKDVVQAGKIYKITYVTGADATTFIGVAQEYAGTKSFNVNVTGYTTGDSVKVYVTCGGVDTGDTWTASDTELGYTFDDLDASKTYAIRVEVGAGLAETHTWDDATRTYNIAITPAP